MSDHARQRGFSLRSLISYIIQRRKDARSTRALLDLPDAVLNDIGINRWDVHNALHADWRRLPSNRLTATAASNRALTDAANDKMREIISRTPDESQDMRLAA